MRSSKLVALLVLMALCPVAAVSGASLWLSGRDSSSQQGSRECKPGDVVTVVIDRIGIRVLRDPFTSKPNVLFYTTKRVGGGIQNFEAIKFLKCAA